MMTFILISVLILITIWVISKMKKKILRDPLYGDYFIFGVLYASVTCILIFITIAINDNTPTAMDVYQGNTVLKRTYIDDVAIDSTVVFKSK